MNIKQEGLGLCQQCGTPLMQAINQPGVSGLCFGCSTDSEPKTGRTVVVHESKEEKPMTGHQSLSPTLSEIEVVDHIVGPASALPKDPDAIRKAIAQKAGGQVELPKIDTLKQMSRSVSLTVELDELVKADCLIVLLERLHDELDNMPFSTMKDAKLVMKLQEGIQNKLIKLRR